MCTVTHTADAQTKRCVSHTKGAALRHQAGCQSDRPTCVRSQAGDGRADEAKRQSHRGGGVSMQAVSRRDQRVCIVRQAADAQSKRCASHTEGAALRQQTVGESVSQVVRQRVSESARRTNSCARSGRRRTRHETKRQPRRGGGVVTASRWAVISTNLCASSGRRRARRRNEAPATPRMRRCDRRPGVSQRDQLVCIVRQISDAQTKRSASHTDGRRCDTRQSVSEPVRQRVSESARQTNSCGQSDRRRTRRRTEAPATPRGRRCDSRQVVSQIDQLVCVVRHAANPQAKRSASHTEGAALACWVTSSSGIAEGTMRMSGSLRFYASAFFAF